MADFTLDGYSGLLKGLTKVKSHLVPFGNMGNIEGRTVFLRHDVDLMPENALRMAQLENSVGVNGTYYFRIVPESYDLAVMKEIEQLGHEIGYHYEDVDLVIRNYKLRIKNEEDRQRMLDLAYKSFCENLEIFRRDFVLKTICMHGSPKSKYDNKIIWEKYSYKDLGIIGEPYFDIDWNEFGYLTDTGRRWNGDNVSVRDKVISKYKYNFKTTQDIIDNIHLLPPKMMITIHPQRWHNSLIPWTKELIVQNVKNVAKFLIIKNKGVDN